MSDYAVYCKTDEEITEVLKKMDKKKIRLDNGGKPTKWRIGAPTYLGVTDNAYLIGFDINMWNTTIISAEEYLTNDRKVKELEIFSSMPHKTFDEIMTFADEIYKLRKSYPE